MKLTLLILFAITLIALLSVAVRAMYNAYHSAYQGRTHRKRALQTRLFIRWCFSPFIWAMHSLAVLPNLMGLNASPPVALANELALMGPPHETLTVDPTESLPVANRWLLYQRGSTQYLAKLCTASTMPLGPSPDSPYATGDLLTIYRLANLKHFALGVPNTAITVDDLVITAAGGKVQAFTGASDGTYWVVGRCLKTVASTAAEVAYSPVAPFKITITSGSGTLVVA